MEWEYEHIFETQYFRIAKLKKKFRAKLKHKIVIEVKNKQSGYWSSYYLF